MTGSSILPGQFTAVQQSIGCGKNRDEGLAFLVEFVEETKTSGFVADLIENMEWLDACPLLLQPESLG